MSRRAKRTMALSARAAGFAVALVAATATAQENGRAQALFDDGMTLIGAGRHADACPKLEESQRIEPRPGTLFNLSACWEQVGRTASAWRGFVEVVALARRAGRAEHEALARQRASALEGRLSKLLVIAPDTSARIAIEVQRDGVGVETARPGVALPLDPGSYTVVVSRPGARSWRGLVRIDDGGQTTTITAPPLAPEEPPAAVGPTAPPPREAPPESFGARRTVALTLGGVGLVAVGVGTYFGIRAIADRDASDERCSGTTCDREGAALRYDSIHEGNASTVAFAVGAGALGSAIVLWLTAPSGAPAPRTGGASIAVRAHGTGLSLGGRW